MRFFKNWLRSQAEKEVSWEPATGEQLRRNIRRQSTERLAVRKQMLTERLNVEPPEHANLLLFDLQKLSNDALRLGMLEWREGRDPRAHFEEIKTSFDTALPIRPDILPGRPDPSFLPIVSGMMGWDFPFNADPPAPDQAISTVLYLERWMIAGLADPSCWPKMAEAPEVKNKFVQKSLTDYWALLTDQIDADEGMARCIKNYERRATHQTFKVLSPYLGGGAYNELFVDYTLAAILKHRRLRSNSVHDWIWD